MFKITQELVSELSEKAKSNPRKRLHYNFHKSYSEKVQRLLNACDQHSYFRPHCHKDSGVTEIIVLLRGRLLVVEFNETGEIIDHIILEAGKGNAGVELPPEVWHSMIALDEDTVMYEVKEGPFDENRMKLFAAWSPEEESEEAKLFNQNILAELGITQ